jgi:sphingomyelin phosphodiesterase acid-like 3
MAHLLPRPSTALFLTVLALTFLMGGANAGASPWLFVTDIHLEAAAPGHRRVSYTGDTNGALFASALREMHAVDPDPPVVVIGGDLLAHDMDRAHATITAVGIARDFDRVYPHAQFILTLGNVDSSCGDYGLTPDSPFLAAVARAWDPLVNRHDAAPRFLQTFPRDGFYTARLPLRSTRAVVIDDVFWSPRYHPGCGTANGISAATLQELARALPVAGMQAWLFLHIPPGIDAFSTTHLTHGLAVIPFLDPGPRGELVALAGDPTRHVALIVAAHTHRFAYRIINASGADPVPMLLVPAISPIFGNTPSFLTAEVAPDGTVRNVEDWSLVHRVWRDIGGLGSLGVPELSGGALRGLQGRLAIDRRLRALFAALYGGDADAPEINENNWHSYWCAATNFASADFRACTEQGGFSILTSRGIAVSLVAALLASLGVAAIVLRLRARSSLRKS